MFMIVGLGNPGRRYEGTRHNAGFLVADSLAAQFRIPLDQKKFTAVCGQGEIGGRRVMILKPQSFMNLSGEAVRKFFDYFKMERTEDIIVVHDDLDLPFGVLRLKAGGGHGGHRGLASVIQHLGSRDFLRVRIGIGKPVEKGMAEHYVLEPFSAIEAMHLAGVVTTAGQAVEKIISAGMQAAMNKYNGSTINNFSEEV